MKYTYRKSNVGIVHWVITTAIGAPMKPQPKCQTKSQLSRMFRGAAMSSTYVLAAKSP